MAKGLNIYVVESTTTGERWIVVAESAKDAVADATSQPSTVEVGRLGSYEPGEMGARMTGDYAVIAHQL